MQTRIHPPGEYSAPPQYPIESVDNALKAILMISDSPRVRTTDVSQSLGIASSSAHRLLSMLQYRGFARQDLDTKAYTAGPALETIARGVREHLDLAARVQPVLVQLSADLGETVHLGRLQGSDVLFIAAIESLRALRVGIRLGRAMPAHCTSTGKAMLATLSDEQVRLLYPQERLVQLTPRSIATRSELLSKLAEVRHRGWATSREESEEGVSSIAVAVPNNGITLPLAVNASLPQSRMGNGAQRAIRDHLTSAARTLRELAY